MTVARGTSVSKKMVVCLVWTLCLLMAACTVPAMPMSKPTQIASHAVHGLRNPIAPIADPFVFYYDGSYYLTGTSTAQSLEMWHSPRLENVSSSSTTIWTPGKGEPSAQVWSPSVFQFDYHGSRHWFVYFTASADNTNAGHRIYALQSEGTNPLGPYTFQGQLHGTDASTAIDASLLQIQGKLYMLYVREEKTNAIYIAPMSDPLTVNASPHLLVSPDEPWEQGEGSGQSRYPVAEGPEALYHNGKTFVVYSGSDTGNFNYCLGLLIYDGKGNPLDSNSWAKKGPVFQFSSDNGVFGPGRATFTVSPDGKQYWMVYHAKTTAEYQYTGRETRAQPYTWNVDGTPNFGVPASVNTVLTPPSGE